MADGDAPPRMPTWAKVLVGVAAALVLGFVALHLMGAARMGH